MTKNLQIFPLLSHKYEGVNFKSLSNTAAVMISCYILPKKFSYQNSYILFMVTKKIDMQEKCYYMVQAQKTQPSWSDQALAWEFKNNLTNKLSSILNHLWKGYENNIMDIQTLWSCCLLTLFTLKSLKRLLIQYPPQI